MNSDYFDIKRDNQLMAAVTHFWCRGHLYAVQVGGRSVKTPDYCQDCEAIREREAHRHDAGRWTKDGKFITGGKEFILADKDTMATATSPVKAAVSRDKIGRKVVAKLPDEGIALPQIMKQGRGRPPKQGEVSWVTACRREKRDREIKRALLASTRGVGAAPDGN